MKCQFRSLKWLWLGSCLRSADWHMAIHIEGMNGWVCCLTFLLNQAESGVRVRQKALPQMASGTHPGPTQAAAQLMDMWRTVHISIATFACKARILVHGYGGRWLAGCLLVHVGSILGCCLLSLFGCLSCRTQLPQGAPHGSFQRKAAGAARINSRPRANWFGWNLQCVSMNMRLDAGTRPNLQPFG